MMNKKLLIIIIIIAFIVPAITKLRIDEKQQFYKKKIDECELLIQQSKSKINDVIKQSLEYTGYKNEFNKFDDFKNKQIKWSVILNQIMEKLPKSIWLENFTARQIQVKNLLNTNDNNKNNSYNIVLSGKTTNPDSINEFVAILEDINYLEQATVQALDNKNLVWHFQIKSTLN